MKDVAKTFAVGVSAVLFALAIAQAQPGCDAGGGTERSAPAKAEAPKDAKPETPKVETPTDAKPAVPVEEPPAPPPTKEAPTTANPIFEANPDATEEPRAKPRKKKKEEPDAKVFLPATKSGAFIPPQQANAPAQQR